MIWFIFIYSIVFSVGCFFYVTHIYAKRLEQISSRVDQILDDTLKSVGQEYEEKFSEYKLYQKQTLIETQKSLQETNTKNLNQLNTDISKKLDQLANDISKRPII
jgi:BMFP domain-containing protein YqiC